MAKKKMGGLGKGLDLLFADLPETTADDAAASTLPLREIEPDPAQPRKKFDDDARNQLADSITVGSVNSTQIMAITVTNENPGLAGKIAQTIAEVAPDVIVEKVEAGSCKAVSDVEIGTTPVYPQTKKTTLLCALAGMVAACALLVVSHLLHNYIVDDEDVQKKLDLPVLGFIPEV